MSELVIEVNNYRLMCFGVSLLSGFRCYVSIVPLSQRITTDKVVSVATDATVSTVVAMARTDPFSVTFEGRCYELKQFLRNHPGGLDTLKKYEGKSIVHAMEKFGHSNSAYHMLNDFKVDEKKLKDSHLNGKVSENGRILTNDEAERDVEEIKFLEELESRLDWSKPLLSQLDAIAPHYDKWVNTAVYRRCRLFASPVLESLTYTPWYLVPMFWIPVILYMGCTQLLEHVLCEERCSNEPLSTLQFVFHLAAGIVIWTALEYSLHRWVFHLDPGSSLTMMKLHFLIHGIHHKTPFDGLRLVFPPVPACFLALTIYIPVHWGLSYPLIKMTGGLAGYLIYDIMHYYLHHGSPGDGTYLYTMKRYHSNHHFLNHDKAFGISNDVWDHVFKTFVQVRRLGFSLRW